jgi:hypothetical protein
MAEEDSDELAAPQPSPLRRSRPPGGKRLRVALAAAVYVLCGEPFLATQPVGLVAMELHLHSSARLGANAPSYHARRRPLSSPQSRAGVPVWWWLTSLHRPPLPLQAMHGAADAAVAALPVTLEAYVVAPGGGCLVQALGAVVRGALHALHAASIDCALAAE